MTTDPGISVGVGAPPKLARQPRTAAWIALGLGLAAAGLLFAIDPAKHGVYPVCWFYATTGLQCPGCGGLRATHQLLHGHLAAAWALNPLAVLLAPFVGWFAIGAVLRLLRGRGLPAALPRPSVIWLGAAALLLFGVLRNLPLH